MTFIFSLILGVVEGFTEFLPISSTAHLMIVSRFLAIPATDYLKTFEVAIQLGAISAVMVVFFKKIISDLSLVKYMVIGFIPTGLIGFAAYPLVRSWLGSVWVALGALFLGGVFILLFEKLFKEKNGGLDYKKAFLIGCFQCASFVPGVSRALATIVGGMVMGLPRRSAVEFSFLLAIPTMMAATAFDLYKNFSVFTPEYWWFFAVGFFAAFISAFIGIRFFVDLVERKNLEVFGWYRICLVIIVILASFLFSKPFTG